MHFVSFSFFAFSDTFSFLHFLQQGERVLLSNLQPLAFTNNEAFEFLSKLQGAEALTVILPCPFPPPATNKDGTEDKEKEEKI